MERYEGIHITEELAQDLESLCTSYLSMDGRKEILNPKPLNIHIDLEAENSLEQRIARCLAAHTSLQKMKQGEETYEEAMDFGNDENDGIYGTTAYTEMVEELPSDMVTGRDNSNEPAPAVPNDGEPEGGSVDVEPTGSEQTGEGSV